MEIEAPVSATSIAHLPIKKAYIVSHIIVICLFVFQFGYNLFTLNPLADIFATKYGWTVDQQKYYLAFFSAVGAIGGIIGSILAKYLIAMGKLRAIYLSNALIGVSASLTLIDNLTVIMIGRFFLGMAACGFSFVIVPKFIYETAPVSMRGILGSFSQLFLFAGFTFLLFVSLWAPNDPQE